MKPSFFTERGFFCRMFACSASAFGYCTQTRYGIRWNRSQKSENGGVRMSLLEEARGAWQRRDLWRARLLIDRALGEGETGDTAVKVHFAAGLIYREVGDLAEAMDHLGKVQVLLDGYPELRPLMGGVVLYNQALVERQRRNIATAERLFDQAQQAFAAEGLTAYQVQALHNLSWVLCEQKRTEEASAVLDLAYPLLSTDEMRRRHKLAQAYCYLQDGNFRQALELSQDLITCTDLPDVSAYAYLIWGSVGYASGDYTNAEAMVNYATSYAVESADTRCMNDLNQLRVRIAEARNALA